MLLTGVVHRITLLLPFLLVLLGWDLFAASASTSSHSNVRDYGALWDEKNLYSPAINQGIEAAAAAGGWTIDFPAGTYRSGSIRLKNLIDGVDPLGGIIIAGMPGAPLEEIRLENIRLTSKGGGKRAHAAKKGIEATHRYPKPDWAGTLPAYGVYARHVKGLSLANIKTDFSAEDFRPGAKFEDIEGLEINHFKARVLEGIPATVIAQDVKGCQVRNSPGIENKSTTTNQ